MKFVKLFLIIFAVVACSSSDSTDTMTPPDQSEIPSERYFPPNGSTAWETISVADLEWNEEEVQPLLDYLEQKNTKAFIILKNGRIVVEHYFDDFTQSNFWYWASAGKTLTALTVGIAQEEGLLSIDDKTSDYLGEGWTSLEKEKEDLITVKHQLIMSSGLDESATTLYCTDVDCLYYKADAGTRWYYHNAPYTLLQPVISSAVGKDFEDYMDEKLTSKIGMNGFWLQNGYNNVYRSTPRDMARFGLLILNKGVWDDTTILGDTDYFNAMTTKSQNLNPAYGYLWWLNSSTKFRLPASEIEFSGNLIPTAPSDLIAGLGANDQKLYVVPSEELVVIRMGDAADSMSLALSDFDEVLWEKISAVIK